MNPTQIVQTFYRSLEQKDFAALRACFHPRFSFQGPIDTFDRVEPYLEAVTKLSAIVKRVEVKRLFADGDDVCVLYDLVTDSPAGTSFVAEWFQVKAGKIAKIQVVFDARPFAAMFAAMG